MEVTKVRSNEAGEVNLGKTKASKAKDANSAQTENVGDLLTTTKPTSKTVEKVKWSPDAQMAGEALAEAKAAPDVRTDRVAQLKAAIQNGSYKVDSQKVADKMIEDSLEEGLVTRKTS